MPDVIVVGAGAAGLMAAGTAAYRGLDVWLVEKNSKPGKKLQITGKGRCNLTNDCTVQEFLENVPTNPQFLYGALTRFSPADTKTFFEGLGVPLKTERGRRVFPQSDQAEDVVKALTGWVESGGVSIVRGSVCRLLTRAGKAAGVQLTDGRRIEAHQVILCCGGASYPATGSTGAGFQIAQQAGHTIRPLCPSLVPLNCAGEDCGLMAGLTLRNVACKFYDCVKKKVIHEEFGEMSFRPFGVGGPIILSGSAHLRNMSVGRYRIDVDLKPALSPEKLDARLVRDLQERSNQTIVHSLPALLPRQMIHAAVYRSGIPPQTRCGEITREQRRVFGKLLKQFSFTVTGFRPLKEAIVTSGGVAVNEISPQTMQSKIISGLYIAGEMLDVDAYTGGYNLQIAFSTGRLAGENVQVRE
ncbi:MAG TPA: aminoacetone oxidase family FAD-binding enzyme [Ruminococcaceae bacterium]|nr:aminoacetone oxidase family FAD-binding enzyme [Oscillospiraceae bacterium]